MACIVQKIPNQHWERSLFSSTVNCLMIRSLCLANVRRRMLTCLFLLLALPPQLLIVALGKLLQWVPLTPVFHTLLVCVLFCPATLFIHLCSLQLHSPSLSLPVCIFSFSSHQPYRNVDSFPHDHGPIVFMYLFLPHFTPLLS